MNRILLYVHFSANRGLSEHVVYQLRQIRPLYKKVVFVTNSEMSAQNKERLDGLYDNFTQRENIGFDFGAWRDAMKSVGWKELEAYDSVTLMNDTCFGPIYPFEPIYDEMESKKYDFWGVTDYEFDTNDGVGKPIPHHIQSYFQVFNQCVVRSSAFKSFWEDVKDHTSLDEVISDYETKLTKIIEDAGFTWGVYFDAEKYSSKHPNEKVRNYAKLAPRIIIRQGVPLLKINSFLYFSARGVRKQILTSSSDYPVSLIDDHLKSIGTNRARVVKLSSKRAAIGLIGVKRIKKISKSHPKLYRAARKIIK